MLEVYALGIGILDRPKKGLSRANENSNKFLWNLGKIFLQFLTWGKIYIHINFETMFAFSLSFYFSSRCLSVCMCSFSLHSMACEIKWTEDIKSNKQVLVETHLCNCFERINNDQHQARGFLFWLLMDLSRAKVV